VLAPLLVRRVAPTLATLGLALIALVAGTVTAVPATAATGAAGLTDRLNDSRLAHGLPALASRSDLVEVARAQAARMAAAQTLFHNPQLATDVTRWRQIGENVGDATDIATVHRAFMSSAPHRANILDGDYTEVGVGVVERGGQIWVAEVFRQPLRATTSTTRSAPTTVAGFRTRLHYGSTGDAVRRVQGRLHLHRTGFYGTATKAAVSRFQRAQGWAGRGNVGRLTWSRLF
jgi:hypothetical protein